MTDRQRTLLRSGSIDGIGLHSGGAVSLTLHPTPPHHGLKFQRLDLPDRPSILAIVDNAVPAARHTLLSDGRCQILTCEHILSALYALNIDNALITLTASEPPICDGSARPFVDLINACGIAEQDAERLEALRVSAMLRLQLHGTEFIVLPYEGFRITCLYADTEIQQHESIDITATSYGDEICEARTFVWWKDVEPLVQQGLIKGGSLESAVVLGTHDEPLDSVEWRYPNEIARHKILDLVGDLSLLGCQLRAHVIAIRPGHTANGTLVRELRKYTGRTSAAKL